MSDIEIAVNAWYTEWSQSHNRDEGFELLLTKYLPHLQFSYCTHSFTYILIGCHHS